MLSKLMRKLFFLEDNNNIVVHKVMIPVGIILVLVLLSILI